MWASVGGSLIILTPFCRRYTGINSFKLVRGHVEVTKNQSSGERRPRSSWGGTSSQIFFSVSIQGRVYGVEVAVMHVQHDPFLRKAAWER